MKFKILGILGVILLVGIGIGSYFLFGNYSEGYRSGTLMKVSKKGVLFKTYEGELNVGGMQSSNNDGIATTVWAFSVIDEEVVNKLEKAVDNQSKVKLFYNERFYQFDWRGDTKYFVYKVEEL